MYAMKVSGTEAKSINKFLYWWEWEVNALDQLKYPVKESA